MPTEFTEQQIHLCHEAKEFDHQYIVCASAEDDEPGEAVPGRDF